MLLRKGKEYIISDDEVKEMNQLFPDGKIVLKYVDELTVATKPQEDGTVKKLAPPSITIPLRAVFQGKQGSEEWQYYETAEIAGRGPAGETLFNYTPALLTVVADKNGRGRKLISTADKPNLELAYFLLKISPFVKNSANVLPGSSLKLEVEVKSEVVKKKYERGLNKHYIPSVLYGNQLSLAEIREIASASGVFDSQLKDKEELIVELVELGERSTPYVYLFKNLVENKQERYLKQKIQQAIEMSLIARSETEWYFCNDQKKRTSSICPIRNAATANKELYEYLLTQPDVREHLTSIVQQQIDLSMAKIKKAKAGFLEEDSQGEEINADLPDGADETTVKSSKQGRSNR